MRLSRSEWKAARRSVLVQCDQCKAIGSGRINAIGRLTGVTLPAYRVAKTLRHKCGGVLMPYDI